MELPTSVSSSSLARQIWFTHSEHARSQRDKLARGFYAMEVIIPSPEHYPVQRHFVGAGVIPTHSVYRERWIGVSKPVYVQCDDLLAKIFFVYVDIFGLTTQIWVVRDDMESTAITQFLSNLHECDDWDDTNFNYIPWDETKVTHHGVMNSKTRVELNYVRQMIKGSDLNHSVKVRAYTHDEDLTCSRPVRFYWSDCHDFKFLSTPVPRKCRFYDCLRFFALSQGDHFEHNLFYGPYQKDSWEITLDSYDGLSFGNFKGETLSCVDDTSGKEGALNYFDLHTCATRILGKRRLCRLSLAYLMTQGCQEYIPDLPFRKMEGLSVRSALSYLFECKDDAHDPFHTFTNYLIWLNNLENISQGVTTRLASDKFLDDSIPDPPIVSWYARVTAIDFFLASHVIAPEVDPPVQCPALGYSSDRPFIHMSDSLEGYKILLGLEEFTGLTQMDEYGRCSIVIQGLDLFVPGYCLRRMIEYSFRDPFGREAFLALAAKTFPLATGAQ